MTGIYKITNLINNKCYIGRSKNIQERWNEHCRESSLPQTIWDRNARGEQTYFHKALRKYGKEAFSFEIIEQCLEEELNEREIYWIAYYDSTDPEKGYNTTKGGDGYRCGGGENAPGSKITQEECNLIKQKLKERLTAAEIIKIVPNATIGIISSINNGNSWFDPNENYPISINNGHRKWSDEEAMQIKYEYANGANISELAKKYQVNVDTISNLINGKSYINLPIIERKVEWKRKNTTKRPLSEESVKLYREEVKTASILSVYNKYKE